MGYGRLNFATEIIGIPNIKTKNRYRKREYRTLKSLYWSFNVFFFCARNNHQTLLSQSVFSQHLEHELWAKAYNTEK